MFLRLVLLTVGTLVGMLALAYFTTDTNQREAPKAAAVLDLFDKVAFSGFGEGGPTGSGPYLRRWNTPARVAVIGGPQDGDAATAWKEGVSVLAGLYDQLPGLDVAVVDTRAWDDGAIAAAQAAGASLLVITVPEAAVEGLITSGMVPSQVAGRLASARAGGCGVAGAQAAVLAQVAIFLRADLGDSQRNACLGEGLAMALGFNVEAKAASDVFRLRSGPGAAQITFHPLGRMALALSYDPALEPGMPRAVAMDKAATLLKGKGLE